MKDEQDIKQYLQAIYSGVSKANEKLDRLTANSKDKTESRPIERYLTVKEVSALIGLSERTIYRRYYEGKLKSFKLGGLRVFAMSEIKRFIANEQQAKESQTKAKSKGRLEKWFRK